MRQDELDRLDREIAELEADNTVPEKGLWCAWCGKEVDKAEVVVVEGQPYHKACCEELSSFIKSFRRWLALASDLSD